MIEPREVGFGAARSVLVVPGHDMRKMERAHDRGADLVVFDLEDSVPFDRKNEARQIAARFIRPGDCVRVNAVSSTDFSFDMHLARETGAVAMIPKVERRDLQRIVRGTAILSIESPGAVLAAEAIAAHSLGIAFGRCDLMACCGISDTWSPLIEHAMAQVALAAMAAGVRASDAPCYSISDGDLLKREIDRARAFGFTSKCCIHPGQIAACAAFGRRPEELESAAEVLDAWNDAEPIAMRSERMFGPPDYRLALKVAGI